MKITIKNFQKKIPIYPRRIKRAILKVLAREGLRKFGEITVCFVNAQKIKELNTKYHNKNIPTDVLAFNISGPKKPQELLADLVVSVDAAIKNAKLFKTTPIYELNLYVIHGVLHLLGYNDRNAKERRLMRKRENLYVYP